MKQATLSLLAFLLSAVSYSQSQYLPVVESSIGMSQLELKAFIKGVLNGGEPMFTPGKMPTYSIDNADMQTLFYISRDSCLTAAIVFQNKEAYITALDQIKNNYPAVKSKPNGYYKISKSERKIYFSIDVTNMAIMVMDETSLKTRP